MVYGYLKLPSPLSRYGHQRMFGSLGWGLAMFFVGIALDHSTAFSAHPCGNPQRYEKNYTICFATFSVLMGAALLTASQVLLPCCKSLMSALVLTVSSHDQSRVAEV